MWQCSPSYCLVTINVLNTLYCLQVSQTLLDDFRSCDGYVFLVHFLLRLEKDRKEQTMQVVGLCHLFYFLFAISLPSRHRIYVFIFTELYFDSVFPCVYGFPLLTLSTLFQALRNLVLFIHSLTTCGHEAAKVSIDPSSIYKLEGFVLPQPIGKGE